LINQLIERNPRFANWLYGFTPPESGTIVLVHRRVYIVPTQLGWLFALTLLILLIGSINYALSLGFALTFLLAGMGLAAMAHTARNLARMAISVGRVEPVFAGEQAQFRLHLDSRESPLLAPYRNLKASNQTRWARQFVVEGRLLVERLFASDFEIASLRAQRSNPIKCFSAQCI